MFLKKGQLPIVIVNAILILIFGIISLRRENYEFIAYIVVIVFFFALILSTNKKNNLSNGILWALTLWAFLHMFGGIVRIGDGVAYKLILIKIIETSEFTILRYDQAVHALGFGVATMVGYSLLKPYLNSVTNWKVVSVFLVLIGMGAGALNEIIEFMAVLYFPETGVGGYYNNSWDLVFNGLGAVIAVIWINIKRRKENNLEYAKKQVKRK